MRTIDDDELLRDGEQLRVPLLLMDSVQRSVARTATTPRRRLVADAFGNSDHFALGRPGPRYGVDRGYGDDERAAAYREVALRDAEAWRTPPVVVSVRDAAPPDGAYPLSAGEGTACTINGRPGTLERDGDWLQCVPDDDTTGDAREDAYAEVALRDENAWKGDKLKIPLYSPSGRVELVYEEEDDNRRNGDSREDAYREVALRDANAWRNAR
jgi:hypothetical protein